MPAPLPLADDSGAAFHLIASAIAVSVLFAVITFASEGSCGLRGRNRSTTGDAKTK